MQERSFGWAGLDNAVIRLNAVTKNILLCQYSHAKYENLSMTLSNYHCRVDFNQQNWFFGRETRRRDPEVWEAQSMAEISTKNF